MIERLIQLLGRGRVLTQEDELLPYSSDATVILAQAPRVVVFPHTSTEVSSILTIAKAAGVTVVTRGGGSGLSGGAVPSRGSLVLCLTQMDRILEVDPRNFTLRAQAGALTQAVHDAADAQGLFYPPDPGSMKLSTIGGNVAENAGGLHGLKYGVTGDYVLGLEVVMADGEICRLGNKCVKDVAGYNLKELFVGSEGTLGVVTEVLLKLIPKPAARRTLLATFTSLDTAAETVSAIIAARIVPCTLEFLDKRTIRAVEEHSPVGLPLDAEALLLAEVDGHPAAVADEAAQIEAICIRQGATSVKLAADDAEAERLASARRGAFTALTHVSPTAILDDVTVPRSELGAMIRFIQQTAEKHGVDIATFGHFGDGNLHPTFLTDVTDRSAMRRVEAAKAAIFSHALTLGGTITGEHGVGLTKKSFLRSQIGDTQLAVMQRLKGVFDPENLLNPGKIFDPS